jgi:hypothetical protein
VCDGSESCLAGICRAGTALDCDDADDCTADACDPTAGCRHVTLAGCASCAAGTRVPLEGKRVGLFKTVYGIRMTATGTLRPVALVDVTRSGLTLEIVDADGDSLYRAIVPPSLFEHKKSGDGVRLVRSVDPDLVGGLRQLRLRVRADRSVVFAAQGFGDRLPDELPSRITAILAVGDQCGVDSCFVTARKCDCR